MLRRSSRRPRASRKRRRWYLVPFIFVTLLAALVWFAPTLIALSPLKQRVVGWTTGELDVDVSIGSASLGWLSPVEVSGIVAEDPNGDRLAEVSALRTEKSLASLLWRQGDLGVIHLDRPHLRCALRPDGSNVEDALRTWLQKPQTQSTTTGVELKVDGGIIEATEVATGKTWVVDNLDLQLTIPAGGKAPAKFQVGAQVTDAQGLRSNVAAEGQWQPLGGSDANGAGEGDLTVRTSALPLDLPAVGLKRIVPGLQLAGLLTSDIQFAWQGDEQQVRIAQVEMEEVTWADPTWIGADRVLMPLLRVAGQATRAGDTWQLRDVAVTSDLASFSASGTVGAPDLQTGDGIPQILAAVAQAHLQADGVVDVAQLAAMMPHTLNIRQGTQITSGQISVSLNSEPLSDGHKWDLRLLAEKLAAVHQNRRIAWEQPIEVTVAARRNQAAITLDQVEWKSSFLKLIAQGSPEQGSLSLQGDLARFRAEASQFIDLGDLDLSGKLQATMDWRSDPQRRVFLEGEGTADDFQLVTAKGRPWREQQLAIRVGGTARTNEDGLLVLDGGNLKLISGRDQLTIEVLEPTVIQSAARWPLRLHVVGDISNWRSRIQVAAPLGGWEVDGGLDFEGTVRVSPHHLALDVTQCRIQDLYCNAAGLRIAEPMMQLNGQGEWDRAGRQFRLEKGTLASTSVAMRVNDATLTVTDTSVELGGQSVYRVQLERLGEWVRNTSMDPLRRFSGEAKGQIRLTHADQITNVAGSAEVKDFAYIFPADSTRNSAATPNPSTTSSRVWREPKLEFTIDGNYSATRDTLEFSNIRIAGQSLDLSTAGSVSDLQNRRVVQLDGQVAYDLERLIGQFGRQFASRVRMVGRDTSQFSLNGPLFSAVGPSPPTNTIRQTNTGGNRVTPVRSNLDLAAWQGQANLSWQAAAIEGFSLGPGTLDTTLLDGVVVASPMDFEVSEGRVRLAPRLHLNQKPMLLTLPSGTTAEQVHLSPEMCGKWLKYVAPLVAEAAAAEGTFSVTLDKTLVPIAEPSDSQIQGTLAIHAARVGPGPLSQRLLTTAAQIKSIVDGRPFSAAGTPSSRWLEIPQQNVSFTMADQRVVHQGLQFVVDDVVFSTSGSVTFDQSLDLIAEVPIRQEWVTKNRYLASLQGQVLRLPIQGTLKNPRVDGGALSRLGQQTLGGAASQLLEQELQRGLQRGLQRFLGPRE